VNTNIRVPMRPKTIPSLAGRLVPSEGLPSRELPLPCISTMALWPIIKANRELFPRVLRNRNVQLSLTSIWRRGLERTKLSLPSRLPGAVSKHNIKAWKGRCINTCCRSLRQTEVSAWPPLTKGKVPPAPDALRSWIGAQLFRT
jgi:hypothetical protein